MRKKGFADRKRQPKPPTPPRTINGLQAAAGTRSASQNPLRNENRQPVVKSIAPFRRVQFASAPAFAAPAPHPG